MNNSFTRRSFLKTSAAAATLVLSRSAEGDEAIKNLLVGNVLLVTKREVLGTFGLFAAIGAMLALSAPRSISS